ncbi:MAG TPA: hypothetical protein VF463_16415 [Sphingobium sp.]
MMLYLHRTFLLNFNILIRCAAFLYLSFAGLSAAVAAAPKYDREFHDIAAKCKVPRQWLELSSDGFVRIRAPDTATYNEMRCVFDQLKAHKIPTKIGYVGSVG